MIRKIEVMGIELDNDTVREAILKLDREMSDQRFHIIEEVNMDLVLLAGADESVRQTLALAEHTVISEIGILKAVNAAGYQRSREIEHHDFFYELMRRLERNHKRIFVLADSEQREQEALGYLEEEYGRCEIAGSVAVDAWEGDTDAIINEINAVTPDVILSILPSPQQEYFLLDNREKISANLWYGVGRLELTEPRRGLLPFLRRLLKLRKLERQIHEFHIRQEKGHE